MTVSVVIAAHNEAASIADVVRGVAAALGSERIETIVVDDGSSDGTARLAEAAGARVVQFSQNRGKGVALRRGIAETTGDWVVFLDADGQDDPAEIPLLLKHVAPGVALINGSRFIGTLLQGAISAPNWVGNVAFTGLFAALYGVLYVLLSLEAYSLLIGALMLFAALAGVMYLTRNLDWGGLRGGDEATG